MRLGMTKCRNVEKAELLGFLKRKPAENCFLIGDIENFDLDKDFIDENCLNVAGIEETIDRMTPFLLIKEIKKEFLAELSRDSFNKQEVIHKPIKAKETDIDELFEFQKSIEEFNLTNESKESFGKEIKSNTGRIYFCRYGNDIVSSATLTAENSINGMIIGVATAAEYRRKGYAKSCMNALCKELVTDGKSAILFYRNKDAGRLYKSIGFKDINRWAIAVLK